MSKQPPLTAAEVPPDWTAMVGEILRRDGQPMRPHSTLPMIEVKSLTNNQWGALMLFGNGMRFATMEDRDAVMRRIEA